MFKKSCKVSNSHALSNKDKKKLKDQLVNKQGYTKESIESIFEGDLFMDKLVGQKAVVYSKNGTPTGNHRNICFPPRFEVRIFWNLNDFHLVPFGFLARRLL